MRRAIAAAAVAASILLAPSAGRAQSSEELGALKKEVEALKARQDAMLKELQEIRAQLRQQRPAAQAPEPRDIVVAIDGAPSKGDPQAKIAIIDFSDYQCPFCARHVRETVPRLQREYIATGKVRYVARDFPLESIHPQALDAAEAAHCAGEQKAFWPMHDRLFANQRALGPADLEGHAQALGLDVSAFKTCLSSGKYEARIRQDLAEGQRAGVSGTPSFLLGVIQPGGSRVKVVQVLKGAQPYAAFKEALDGLLAAPQ